MFNPHEYIATAVVPVAMISACGLISLALYNRLAAIVGRLRILLREQIQKQPPPAGATSEFVQQLAGAVERQLHHVLRRARLIRAALVFLLGSIICMAICSLLDGIRTAWDAVAPLTLACFVLGQLLLITGLLLALQELRLALRPVEIESHIVEGILEHERRRGAT
jgi:hypothetical protein